MIDIHSHILPGVDDGAPDLDAAVAMLGIARESGTTDIVATPHADTKYTYDPENVARLIAELQAKAPDGLRIHRGCDFHLSHSNVEDAVAHPARYTVNGGRYLMTELSDLVIFGNTEESFAALEAIGITIVLTHPERNPLLRQRPELIEEWVAKGRLMQLTASSLLGKWGSKALAFSRLLLDKGLAHFVASDGHDTEHRPPRLDRARAWVERHYPPELAVLLFETHPRAVIRDDSIDPKDYPICNPVADKPGFFSRLFRRNR